MNNWHFAGAVTGRRRECVAKCHDYYNLIECHRKTGGIISILVNKESCVAVLLLFTLRGAVSA